MIEFQAGHEEQTWTNEAFFHAFKYPRMTQFEYHIKLWQGKPSAPMVGQSQSSLNA
jgi:hypothetical protein